jgi:hypothetical protein
LHPTNEQFPMHFDFSSNGIEKVGHLSNGNAREAGIGELPDSMPRRVFMKSQFIKYRILSFCLLTVLLPGVIPPIATAATVIAHERHGGVTAEAFFVTVSGSIESNGYVSATQGKGQDPTTFSIRIQQIDLTNGDLIASYFGENALTASQFRVSNNLQSASLEIVGAVLQDDLTGSFVPVDVSITWTGSGPALRSKFYTSSQYSIPGGTITSRYRSKGETRDATTAGSLVISGTDVLGTEATGELLKSSTVQIDITKSF